MRHSLAAALLGIAVSLPAAEPPPTASGKDTGLIPRKVLFSSLDRFDPRLSPDGKQLAFLAPADGVLNVWIGPADKPDEAKPVTRERKRDVYEYHWAYTSRHLLYVQDEGGDEDDHVYRVDLQIGETKDLTPLKQVRARIVGLSHRHPGTVLVGLNDRDARYHDLYRIDLATGERELAQKNTEFAGFLTDDDLRVRFARKLAADGATEWLKPDGKNGWEPFLTVPMKDAVTTTPLGFDKAGQVLYLRDSRGRDTAGMTALDLRTGKATVIAQDPRCDAGDLLRHPTERTLQAVSFTYERVRWEFQDEAVAADFAELGKLADGEIAIETRTLDDKAWVVSFLRDDGPIRYYLYDRAARKARFLFHHRADLAGLPLRKMHPRVVRTRDGLDLVCYLTLPYGTDPAGTGKPERPVPMVLQVHGGPWGRDTWGFHTEAQFLANRGYAVLWVNFRGSTGFGKKFVNAANKEWAGKMHDDLLDAVDWAVREKIADPARVGIMGLSYGGYAALVGLTFTPEKFACGVDVVGPSSLVTLLDTVPAYWAPLLQHWKDRVGDHTTEEGRKFLAARSPLTFVDRIKRPLLIGQGANDPRVKQAESDQIVAAMREKNLPVTYALFPDEGHGLNRPANRRAFFAVTEAFLARHLGGRYEAIGEAFDGSTITVPAGADDVPGLKALLPK